MKTEPVYISRKLRSQQAWARAGNAVRMNPDILRELYIHTWCAPIQARDFIKMLVDGEITRKQLLEHDSIAAAKKRFAAAEARRKKESSVMDTDDCDRINFACKAVIQIGDYWEAGETKTYLHGGAYITKGKKYKITSLKDEGFGEFSFTTTTNFPAPDNIHYESCHGVRRLFRKGKLIWDWTAAFILDWDEHHPDKPYPRTAKDKAIFRRLASTTRA